MSKIKTNQTDYERIEMELPVWMIRQLETEAQLIGVTKQDLIKLFLAEKLQK